MKRKANYEEMNETMQKARYQNLVKRIDVDCKDSDLSIFHQIEILRAKIKEIENNMYFVLHNDDYKSDV